LAAEPVGRKAAAVLFAATLSVLGAACGGGDKKSNAATTTTPGVTVAAGRACEVISKTEVEAAIGTRVGNGQASGGGSTAACKYELEGTTQSVIVAVSSETDPQDFQKAKAAVQGAQPVPGVSGESFVAGGRAFVLKGTTLAIVAVNLERPDAQLGEAARKLAQAAAGKL
jgi:hypothetical protein